MKFAIVHPGSGWILSHIAQHIFHQCSGESVFCTPQGIDDGLHGDILVNSVDAFYYVDIQNCWTPRMITSYPNAKHVGFFTHLDKDADKSFRPGWDMLDGVVHMCERYQDRFLQNEWYEKSQMTVIYPGEVSQFQLKPLKLGIAQRGGFKGKGDGFLQKVINGMPVFLKENLILSFMGSGWHSKDFKEVSTISNPHEQYEDYEAFYHTIDYLLIPSLWEGGPMALLEALACGVPIIAPKVGFVSDFMSGRILSEDIIYQSGNVEELQKIICHLIDRRMERRERVRYLNWTNYVRELIAFIESLGDD